MTCLKLKAIVYRYTGVFLAHKEENEYITSKKFWKSFKKVVSKKDNDLSLSTTQGLLVGLWQANNGFARPSSFLRYKKPGLFWKPIAWCVDFYTVLKWDIKDLFRTKKKKK